MPSDSPFVGEPADSREAIMRATFDALGQHGYAGLSIQRIADEADLSKSTFYHHFDDKDDLLTSFIEFMIGELVRFISVEAGDDPRENLRTFLELMVSDDPSVDQDVPEEKAAILGSYVELRAQAVRDEQIRAQFTETDAAFVAQIEEMIENGVESGAFRPVDPARTAEFLSTVLAGNTFRESTRDGYDSAVLMEEIEAYVEHRLLP